MNEYYKDWVADQEERAKQTKNLEVLCQTLNHGIFGQQPYVVFKVLSELKFELIPESAKDKLAVLLTQLVWLPQMQEYIHYTQPLKDKMLKMHD